MRGKSPNKAPNLGIAWGISPSYLLGRSLLKATGLSDLEGRGLIQTIPKALTNRATPEVEHLRAKWASHLPYRHATTMEVLPLDNGISFSGTQGRIRTIGKQLDANIETAG